MKSTFIIVAIALFGFSASAQDYKGTTPRSAEEQLNEVYCTGLFKSTHGTIIDVSTNFNAAGSLNILNWLEGRVAGLQVYTSLMGTSIPVLRGGVPAIFVDEVAVPVSTLDLLNLNDIAIVKIIRTPFFGGFNSGNGAIAIYTLGDEEETED